MMLGYLLARRGLNVTVLEKHADFLRDFRGDTIHPSTITVLGELGLRDAFLAMGLPRLDGMSVVIDGERLSLVDFTTLPEPDNFLVFAPQWDFLNFLAREGAKLPGFDLRMNTTATGLVFDGDTVVGVTATNGLTVRAPLTVAADGRGSLLRAAAGFIPHELGVPIDVLWFRLPKPDNAPPPTLGYVGDHGMVLTIERGDYYQSGMVIPKGTFADVQAAGLPAFRDALTSTAPVLATVVESLQNWDQVKLLSVQLDRLPRWWRNGFMCIGDAAHAMSPVGGVGVNYAIQDAVALANALPDGVVPSSVLAAVQARRERPVIRMQRIQRVAHERLKRPVNGGKRAVPRPARALLRLSQPLVRRVLARVVGLGFLPEHVDG
ncbi:MAG: FAD-dependent oxidoreductase [Salinibacterium sp.]|nr:FAD-dependent oxidoreductase [Salinibacterium sp.]